MKRRKRVMGTAVCLFLCLVLVFLLWVDSGFGQYTLFGSHSYHPERVVRQLMLEKAEEIYRTEDVRLYDAGKHLLMLESGWPVHALCKFENDAAFLSHYFLGPYVFDKEIWLPIYAYTRSPDAAYADMALFISSTALSSDPEKPLQGEYILPSTPCENGIVYFPMSWHSRFVGEDTLINSFRNCVMNGSIVNGIYYRAVLRFYDADGCLISESVFEMGEKES